jgi:parallel beta helix pectate lyase-like protein
MKAFSSTLCSSWRDREVQLFRFFMTLSMLLISLFATSEAATFYVATNGNDYGPGTESQPFRNIAKGITVLRPGDTLFIRGGAYAESINSNWIRIPNGNSWSSAVTVAGYPGETVVIRPGSAGEVIGLAHSYIQYIVFDNLIVDASNVKFGISLTNGAHHIKFQNSEVRNSRLSGILLTNSAGHNQFTNIKVHDNGASNYDHGIYISTSNNLVDRCEVYNNSGYGIHIYNGAGGERPNNNTLERNVVRNNGLQ